LPKAAIIPRLAISFCCETIFPPVGEPVRLVPLVVLPVAGVALVEAELEDEVEVEEASEDNDDDDDEDKDSDVLVVDVVASLVVVWVV